MKKYSYKLDNIDCASCALKIEDGVNNLDGVYSSSLDYMLSKLFVKFDENVVSDEEIETCIHKSLRGVRILEKNNVKFEDTYQEEPIFRKILFKGMKKK